LALASGLLVLVRLCLVPALGLLVLVRLCLVLASGLLLLVWFRLCLVLVPESLALDCHRPKA
jgi:hypothetical protein